MRRSVSKKLKLMAIEESLSRPRTVRAEYRNARFRELKRDWNATPRNERKDASIVFTLETRDFEDRIKEQLASIGIV